VSPQHTIKKFRGETSMKSCLRITYYGTIEDIQNRQDLTLVTDSQDIEAIKDMIAGSDKRKRQRKKLNDYSLFFVNVQDGDYTEIYASTHSVAWLGAHLDKIVPITRAEVNK
jgi:hypothetical protein